jgi:RNA polymerase sigma-70 factor (ECF subfamily)
MSSSNLKDRKDEIEALVVRVKEGDEDAFSDLYDIFIDPIYRYVYYRVNSADAEDLVETVFLKVWENIHKYKQKKRLFSAWMFRIAHNLVVDYYRASKDRNFDELKIDIASRDREHNPIRRAERSLDKEILKKAIKKLKKNYQEIIIYKFINEFSNTEIAEISKKSEGSLRILQHRALKALKKVLEEMGAKYEF